ncbi:MAG TPA: hypothetical protein VN726_19240 [Hanamia sp.]|jgi:hypothetical protein|nr:hypothetical protein [Hanamia sp.]
MNNPLVKKFIPIIILFVVINLLLLIFKESLIEKGFQLNFVFVANLILFLLSSFGFFIQTKSANSSNINAFIRGVYSSLLMKMFVIVAAIFIYIFVTGGEVNKAAIFASMAIYLLYTSIEVVQLMKIARKKPNG